MSKTFLSPSAGSKRQGTGAKLIFRLLWVFARKHPLRTSVAIGLAFAVSALWVTEPLYMRYAINTLMGLREGADVDVTSVFLGWGILFVALCITQSIAKYAHWGLDNLLLVERREEVYVHALNLGVSYHSRQKAGEVVKQLDEGADSLVDLQRSTVIELGPSFLSAFVFMIIGMRIDWRLGAILITVLAMYMGIAFLGTMKTMAMQYAVNKRWVEGIGRAYDAITNIVSVQSGAQERTELSRMRASNMQAYQLQQKVNFRWALVEAVNFFMLTRILLTALGILLFIRNELTLGDLYFFQSSFFRVLTPFEMLANLLPQWNRQVGRVRLSQEILDAQVDVPVPQHPAPLSSVHGEIRLEHVGFAYRPLTRPTPAAAPPHSVQHEGAEGIETEHRIHEHGTVSPDDITAPALRPPADAAVLHDISLTIHPGEHLALVGHSGAGKSTIASLLNRFYDVTSGRILIDGTDVRDFDPRAWRAGIGLVLQENILFNDTVLENIRYARPSATEAEVHEAAERAAAAEFIRRLPQGYDTLIGDRGIRLSGGERQRVAIARAILKNPKIVVLDEATSALDSVTEARVQDGIRELIAGRTAVIIAHRLSTVRSADRIAVLDEGRLIACAPHEELLKTCNLYREMVELQSHGMLAEA